MKKTDMIRLNRDFRRLYQRGRTLASSAVVIYWAKNRRGENRLGITVSKKIGGAVVRNRARRLIKEAYRLNEHRLADGVDMVLVARGRTPKMRCAEVERELLSLWARAGLAADTEESK